MKLTKLTTVHCLEENLFMGEGYHKSNYAGICAADIPNKVCKHQ